MIAYLKGKILHKDENNIVLENNGVGYQVYLNEPLLLKLQIGQETELYIYHQVREDAQILYGFSTQLERRIFLLITSVSGIGPKTGMSFLNKYSPEQLINYISKGDIAAISSISGVGKKTAEKAVLEIKDKVIKLFPEIAQQKNILAGSAGAGILEEGFTAELRLALSSLGYNAKEIDRAVQGNAERLADVTSVEEGIKVVLKNLH